MNKIAAIGIAACAVCILRRHRKSAGVGKLPPRRYFAEIADAQRNGINFGEAYDSSNDPILSRLANKYGFRTSSRSSRSTAEQYFNQLRRQYNAVAGIGATDLPYVESEVHNENGDVIVVYRDYGTKKQQLRDAINYVEEIPLRDADAAYWHTLAYIAGGGKFVWKTKKKAGALISRGTDDILNGSERERKARISYLGSEKNGALSPDQFAERLWSSTAGMDYDGTDSMTMYDGVEQAILSCDSRGNAERTILNLYYDTHKKQDYTEDYDMPF